MRKIAYIFIVLTAIISLTACNHQQNHSTNQEKPAAPLQDDSKNQEKPSSPNGSTNQDKPTTPAQDEDKPNSNGAENKVYQNKVFKDVVVTESGDKIIVEGKAQVFEGVFQYALYDGDKVLIDNHYQTDGAPAWGEFEISFDKELVSTNNIKLELFVYSAKDGSKESTLEIPIAKP